jgi:formylglycine-generating enzyme required for sulfatase activity
MGETFNRSTWKSHVAGWWRESAPDLPAAKERLGVRTQYGLLVASAWLPLLDAYAADPSEAVPALMSTVGAAGNKLVVNLVQNRYDRASGASQAEQEVAERADLRAEYQEILTNLEVLLAARTALGSGWASFETTVRQELADLGIAVYVETGGGMVIRGDVTVQQGDFVGRDKIVHNKIEMIIHQAANAVRDAEEAREVALQRLAEGVQDYGRRLAEVTARHPEELGGPYKGLLAYGLADAELFFGRDLAIAELLERLRRGRLTILHSESGAGKSSLLQAGISPRLLASGHLPVHVRARHVSPSLKIKEEFVADLAPTPELAEASLREYLRRVSAVLGPAVTLYLLLDQFEEFFTLLPDEAQRAAFVDELADCLDDESLNVRWVLAMRSEYFGELAAFHPRIQNPQANAYRLQRMAAAEAREAVTRPAERVGIGFEPGLVDTLLEKFGQENIPPPQVQLVCLELYEALEPGESLITRARYEALGGVQGILRNHLEQVLERDVPARLRPAARWLLESLVTADRRRARCTRGELVAELGALGVGEADVEDVLSRLVDRRLLQVEGEAPPMYELVHDYLLEEIELDPVTRARKAVQALLDREVESHRDHQTLVSAEKLAILEPHSEHLVPDVEALDLLFRSALRSGRPLEGWCQSALRLGHVGALAERWIQSLGAMDEAEASIAIDLLASLPEEETVSQLLELVERESAAAGENPLQSRSIVQRRGLQILAQMEFEASEAYLQGLTPEGYCFVPTGTSQMGSGEQSDEQPVSPVNLPAFWIARSPVTVGEWRAFVEAGGYVEDRYWAEPGEEGSKHRPLPTEWKIETGREDHPVRNLTWYETMAYAAWKAETSGLPVALPTEAEWEKAAGWDRQAAKVRRYPWGETGDPARCNSREAGPGEPTPIGLYSGKGDSPCGAQDMAGNVLEWTRTKHRPYPYRPDDGRESASGDEARVLRGGSFDRDVADARCARRHQLKPALGLSNTGCRVCLRLVPLKG